MPVILSQEQRVCKLALAPLRRQAEALAGFAQGLAHNELPFGEVVVHLIDDAAMAEVNMAILSHTGATDVVTQRYDTLPGEEPAVTGELFVDVQWALAHVPKREGWGPEEEILLYIAHGCDHLTGSDDLTTEERRRMRRRELAWLKRLDREPFLNLNRNCGKK